MKISAVIISLNEEKYIGQCIASLQQVADEILVLDSFSTDGTGEICRRMGIRFEQHPFDGYISQKNRVVRMATHDWILSLDADEALSENLAASIRKWKDQNEALALKEVVAFRFNRRNYFCGKWMRFTSWYPDRKIRLFNRDHASWGGYDPHDRIELSGGRVKTLKGDLLHWAIDSVEEFRIKMDHFARISARAYHKEGRKASLASAALHGFWRWLREYILKFGIFDGRSGWLIARFTAMNAHHKYYYLRQLNKGHEV